MRRCKELDIITSRSGLFGVSVFHSDIRIYDNLYSSALSSALFILILYMS
jgi:hypothetical protein